MIVNSKHKKPSLTTTDSQNELGKLAFLTSIPPYFMFNICTEQKDKVYLLFVQNEL